jgi:hypothetical protein
MIGGDRFRARGKRAKSKGARVRATTWISASVPVRDAPTRGPPCQDERQAIVALRTGNSVGRSERTNLQNDHRRRNVGRNLRDLCVRDLDLRRLEERTVVGFVAGHYGDLSRPMHADDVDPLRIVVEKIRQRSHVVAIPGVAISFHNAPDRIFVGRVRGKRDLGSSRGTSGQFALISSAYRDLCGPR